MLERGDYRLVPLMLITSALPSRDSLRPSGRLGPNWAVLGMSTAAVRASKGASTPRLGGGAIAEAAG